MRNRYFSFLLTAMLLTGLSSLQAQVAFLRIDGSVASYDTLLYIGDPSDLTDEVDAYVTNYGASPKDLKVRREIQNITAGMETYFCWDICYGSSRDTCDNPVTIAGADTNTYSFHSYAKPHNLVGSILVKYRVYDVNNPTDDDILYVKYIFGEVGIEDQPDMLLSAPYPNPAANIVNFDYSLPSAGDVRLYIYDLGGKEIQVSALYPSGNKLQADISGLAPGTYTYRLLLNGQSLRSGKLVRN